MFFVDVSAGGGTSDLDGWSLEIAPVPEPVNVALGVFAGVVVVAMVAGSWPVRSGSPLGVAANLWADAV